MGKEILSKTEPLYSQLQHIIRKRIIRGKYGSCGKVPKETDLMKEFQVGRTTIRKALCGLVNEGLLVRKKRAGTIAINPFDAVPITVVGSEQAPEASVLGNRYFFVNFDIYEGIVRSTKSKVRYLSIQGDQSSDRGIYEKIVSGEKGAVIFLNSSGYENILSELHAKKYPYVVARTPDPDTGFNAIVMDYVGAFQEATEYLLQLGHKKIAFLFTSSTSSIWLRPRFEGYRKALQAHQLEVDERLVRELFNAPQRIPDVVDEWLGSQDPPTAILTANDWGAIDVMNELQRRKVQIPEDISVMGFDNIEESSRTRPPLTTMDGKRYESGVKAVNLLIQIMNGHIKTPCKIILKPYPVFRRSCTNVFKLGKVILKE